MARKCAIRADAFESRCLTNNGSVGARQQSTVIYPGAWLLGATASSLVAAAFCQCCPTGFCQSEPDLLNRLDTNLAWHIWNDGDS